MKMNHLLAMISVAVMLISCDDRDEPAPYVDPRYAEMFSVTDITTNGATFTLKIKMPVTKVDDGYMVDGKYFDSYMFFYTNDPDQKTRLWQWSEGLVRDNSGIYSLTVSDLKPATRYYVKTMAMIAPREMQQFTISESASVLEFETLQ